MKPQVDEVLDLLRQKPLSPLMAWVELGDYRLADSILKLRKRGHQIVTKMKPFTTARGRKVKFAEYYLVKEVR